MIRLIATDLDGTLLTPDRTMPDGAIEAIRAVQAAGIRFAACSGREYSNLRRLFLPLGDSIAYVSGNGALMAAEGKTIGTCPIPREDALLMVEDILSRGMELMVCGRHSSYIFPSNRKFADYIVYGLRNTNTIIHSLQELPEEIFKVSGYTENGMEAIAPELTRRWGDRYSATPGGPKWFDFTAGSKSRGLSALCKYWQIPLGDVAAFGDTFNDESMLDIVGHPYIIEGADPRMKKPAYQVFSSEVEELYKILEAQK